jgi:hypothetical protein
MTKVEINTTPTALILSVLGSRTFGNVGVALVLTTFGTGFILKALSIFFYGKKVQGFIMMFYGLTSVLLSFFVLLTIYWNVGYTYIEFDRKKEMVVLYVRGFPGSNRETLLMLPFSSIVCLTLNTTKSFPGIFLCFDDKCCEGLSLYRGMCYRRRVRLPNITGLNLVYIEKLALYLSKYLGVPLTTEK